jgi:hypothetical protein
VLGVSARRRRIATLALVALLATPLPSDALAKAVCPPPPLSAVPGATGEAATARLRRQLRSTKQQLAQARRRAAAPAPRRGAAARRAAARRRAATARRRAAAARRRAERQHAAALRKAQRLRLVLEDQTATLSFAHDRQMLDVPVVIRTTRPIPRAIRPSDLRLEALRDLHRIGDNLISVPRVVPLTSRLRITRARDRVYFSVCVDGTGLSAGSYTGNITVSGPTRLARIDVPVTVTVKDADFFWEGVVIALLIAGGFLLYKELRNDSKIRYANWLADRGVTATGWRPRATYFFSLQSHYGIDFILLELCVPLVAAFVAMYGIYASTPAWGDGGIAQWFALITAAFTAAGVRSLIVAATPEPKLPSGETQRRRGAGPAPAGAAPPRPRPRPRPRPAVARPAVPAAVPEQVRVVRPGRRRARAARAARSARPPGSMRSARATARPARPTRPAKPAARPRPRSRRRR